jgi:hypothetical protein
MKIISFNKKREINTSMKENLYPNVRISLQPNVSFSAWLCELSLSNIDDIDVALILSFVEGDNNRNIPRHVIVNEPRFRGASKGYTRDNGIIASFKECDLSFYTYDIEELIDIINKNLCIDINKFLRNNQN